MRTPRSFVINVINNFIFDVFGVNFILAKKEIGERHCELLESGFVDPAW